MCVFFRHQILTARCFQRTGCAPLQASQPAVPITLAAPLHCQAVNGLQGITALPPSTSSDSAPSLRQRLVAKADPADGSRPQKVMWRQHGIGIRRVDDWSSSHTPHCACGLINPAASGLPPPRPLQCPAHCRNKNYRLLQWYCRKENEGRTPPEKKEQNAL